jgi:hypothetical protein
VQEVSPDGKNPWRCQPYRGNDLQLTLFDKPVHYLGVFEKNWLQKIFPSRISFSYQLQAMLLV